MIVLVQPREDVSARGGSSIRDMWGDRWMNGGGIAKREEGATVKGSWRVYAE